MDELIKLVMSQVGLDATKAKEAVETVLSFIKSKLPEPFASQVDALVSGKSNPSDLLAQFGGLFGGGNKS